MQIFQFAKWTFDAMKFHSVRPFPDQRQRNRAVQGYTRSCFITLNRFKDEKASRKCVVKIVSAPKSSTTARWTNSDLQSLKTMACQSQVQLLQKLINSASQICELMFLRVFFCLKTPAHKTVIASWKEFYWKIVSESIEVWWGTWLFIFHRRMSTQPSRCANDCFCVHLRRVPAGTCPVCPCIEYVVRTHAVVQPHIIF